MKKRIINVRPKTEATRDNPCDVPDDIQSVLNIISDPTFKTSITNLLDDFRHGEVKDLFE